MGCVGGSCVSYWHTTLPASYLLSCTGHTSCSQLPWELSQAGWAQAPTPITQVRNVRPREMMWLRMQTQQTSQLGHSRSTPNPILCCERWEVSEPEREKVGPGHWWRLWQSRVRDLRQVGSLFWVCSLTSAMRNSNSCRVSARMEGDSAPKCRAQGLTAMLTKRRRRSSMDT